MMTTDASLLYALPAVTIQPVDARSIMLIRPDNGAVAAVDVRWQMVLNRLRVFRTIADHAQVIANSSSDFAGQTAAITTALTQLIERHLFLTSAAVFTQLDQSAPATPASIPATVVAIRTCDRPDALARLLTALAERPRDANSPQQFEVIDDSRDAAAIERNQLLVAQWQSQFDLHYVGRAEQQALCAELIQQQPADGAALQWLLDATHSAHAGAATYGAVYNQLLLRHAGRHLLMLDDDALPTAWLLPDTDWQPLFARGANVGRAHLDRASAVATLTAWSGDPLASHAAALGRPVAAAIRQLTGAAAGAPLSPQLLANVAVDDTVHPYAQPGNIRYTLNGLLGDSGSATDHEVLYQAATALAPLYSDETAYQAWRAAPRCAVTATQRPLLTAPSALHHTTCAGLALTTLIPPVLPTGRGEDALLGSLLGYLHPEDAGLRLPFALEHAPLTPRSWAIAPAQLATPPTANAVMTMWLAAIRAPVEIDPAMRLQLLAATITHCAQRRVLIARLTDIVQVQLHRVLADHFALTRQLLARNSGCRGWRSDITQINQWLLHRLQQPSALFTAEQLDTIATAIQQYAHSLAAWTRAFDWCQQRNSR